MFGLMWKLGCKSRYFRNQLFPISWLISCTRRFITSSYLLPSLNLFILCFCMHLPAVVIFFSNTKWKGIMGNTSDRVAADRHGAKAHRSDSSGHKDHEPSSKMVDSTDDPNIFNTHGPESKVLLQNTTPFLQQPFSKNSPSRRQWCVISRLLERRNSPQIWTIWWRLVLRLDPRSFVGVDRERRSTYLDPLITGAQRYPWIKGIYCT